MHAHSAMISKIMTLNVVLAEAVKKHEDALKAIDEVMGDGKDAAVKHERHIA